MNYQIVLKDIEPIHVAYMKYVGVLLKPIKFFLMSLKRLWERQMGRPYSTISHLIKKRKLERWNFVFQQTQHLLEMV